MAATAMDPVDIANILAQELLYQQVTFHIADSVLSIFFIEIFFYLCLFIFHAAWHSLNYSSRVFFSFLFYCQKTKMIIIILRRGKIIAITVILTITYYVYIRVIYPSRLSVFCFFVYN